MFEDDPLLLEDPLASTREWCMERYLILRAQMPEKKALAEVIGLATAGEGGKVVDNRTVAQWFVQDNWEKAARASAASRLLASEQFRADETLKDQMRRLEDGREILRHIYSMAMAKDADPKLLIAYRQQSSELFHMEEQVSRTESLLARRFGEQLALPRWQRRMKELESAFMQQFHGKGPHYDLLCHRLAAAEVRMSQLEELGVPVGHEEYASLNKTIVDITSQLQKYTESSKIEMLDDERNAAMVLALQLVESVIAPEAPELWARAVRVVRARAEGHDEKDALKMLEAPKNGRT